MSPDTSAVGLLSFALEFLRDEAHWMKSEWYDHLQGSACAIGAVQHAKVTAIHGDYDAYEKKLYDGDAPRMYGTSGTLDGNGVEQAIGFLWLALPEDDRVYEESVQEYKADRDECSARGQDDDAAWYHSRVIEYQSEEIMVYNDSGDREHGEVVALFERALKLAQEAS